jgi:hypothetical protein
MPAKKGYKVCWWFALRPKTTCRVLSATQHRNMREAAETVLMQNPHAFVRVTSPRGGGHGVIYKGGYKGGRARIWKGHYF